MMGRQSRSREHIFAISSCHGFTSIRICDDYWCIAVIAVSRDKLAKDIGVTPDTIRGWQDRHFQKGVHYTVAGKTTLYYLSDIETWLVSRKSGVS